MEYLTLSQATKLLPGRPHPSAVWRWCRRGIRSRCGDVIFLKHIRLGSRIFVTIEDLNGFGERLAAADQAHFEAASRTLPRIRQKLCRGKSAAASTFVKAKERLEDDGI